MLFNGFNIDGPVHSLKENLKSLYLCTEVKPGDIMDRHIDYYIYNENGYERFVSHTFFTNRREIAVPAIVGAVQHFNILLTYAYVSSDLRDDIPPTYLKSETMSYSNIWRDANNYICTCKTIGGMVYNYYREGKEIVAVDTTSTIPTKIEFPSYDLMEALVYYYNMYKTQDWR